MSKFTRDDLEKFHDYNIFVPTRTIYVGSCHTELDGDESGTDALMAERFIKNLHFLEQRSDEPIMVYMNNLGGNWYHGMAMFNAIEASRCHITIVGMGHVMSMGSIILQAADDRVLHRDAVVMIHDGYDGFVGIPRSFEAWAEFSKKLRRRMYEIYEQRSGRNAQFWEEKCSRDYILTAREAIALGLADRLATDTDK